MATAAHVELDPANAGVYHVPDIKAESSNIGSRLLQENHDKYHMYFNRSGFHNHIAHHLLTIYALGATPEEIQQAFDNNKTYQRPQYPVEKQNVQTMSDPEQFRKFLGKEQYFHDFEIFFRQEIEHKGWEAVLNEHVFAKTEHADRMLGRMFAGFLHPLIHLGFGIEFRQPAIIVEALAQSAIHDGWTGNYLHAAEDAARQSKSSKSLVQLIHESTKNEKLRTSAHWDDGNKLRDGVFVRASDEMVALAAQWTVQPDQLEKKTAEMINAAVYFTGAAQRPTKEIKFDFFFMHCVNCSIFFSAFITQPWLSVENKCRLLEWKGRLDLAMYVSRGCPELLMDEIKDYKPRKPDDGWAEIIQRVDKFPDDGHASKLIRALANGEQVCRDFKDEPDDVFPIKGNMWLQLGHMAIDSVEASEPNWVRSTGFDEAWEKIPERARL
ncbi:Baeyer-Villiger monooxygenase dmxR6 [Exophiala dermatitidis]